MRAAACVFVLAGAATAWCGAGDDRWAEYMEAGRAAQKQRDFDSAERMFAAALDGARGDRYCGSVNGLARAYIEASHPEKAEPLLASALASTGMAGCSAASRSALLQNLGMAYRVRGRYAEAEDAYRRSLAALEAALGPDNPEAATALHSIGIVCRQRGRHADAEAALKRALAIREAHPRAGPPDTHWIRQELAAVYCEQGRAGEAERCLAAALQTAKAGSDGLAVAAILNTLGNLNYQRHEYGKAGERWRDSLDAYAAAAPGGHPDAAVVEINLGELKRFERRYPEADDHFRRALDILARHGASGSSQYATCLNNMALAASERGDSARAESLYRRSLAAIEKGGRPDHPQAGVVMSNLAGVLRKRGDLAGAGDLYRRAAQLLEAGGSSATEEVLMSYARLLREQKRKQEAAAVEKRALKIRASRQASDLAGRTVDIRELERANSAR